MKKSVIALAISSLALASVAQAAPQENTFYVGAKAGWSSFHDGLNQLDVPPNGIHKNSVAYGVFGGYQIFNNGKFGLATELAYDDFGSAKLRNTKGNKTESVAKIKNRGPVLSLKGSYQVLNGLDVYGRVGAALVRTDYNFKDNLFMGKAQPSQRSNRVSAVFATGLEYSLPSLPQLATRLEYQWVNNVGKLKDGDGSRIDFRPDIGSVSLGISYRFGQVQAPKVVTKNFAFSSDVLFAFSKASLKPAATEVLDSANAEINALGLETPAVKVSGYADRIGSEKSNMHLSQRRAETVANYLVSKGVQPANITAVGYGETNPATGNTCDKVKGRKALISCLAPDRRVEVRVQGVKKITM
ncbi:MULTISPECIES: porin OmpA [Pasteurellaceae]|uniref:Outer membrane protein A n=1 Tax=Pasteurella atlantica TaxID=2827233 RepID=A0AAW8CNU9_9PAST|nr:porin OmpA [Pasteurella atlantica]MBR0573049.1 porin OmpA [Pasteurella atlantica]MDP8039094.1 porin OmpA [Pasteurella atlantica]MDP8041184.1 porin OmpA [Pasteurella atlantica]MDP8043203.1 porin OmpA [Pasteurella atlantica]MDP8045289.1 porin OmpA [Pasteurella atlantica]